MTRFGFRELFYLSATLLLLWTIPQAKAQAQLENRTPAAEQPPLNDGQLKSFAKAYVEFEKIRAEYEPKLHGAHTAEDKKAVQEEAVAQFGKALENEGLSMQEYSVIFHTVNADEALRERTLQLIEEERAKS